ncbi:MAG: histidine triad nucleotide-binding protein [Myxococcales bacterium]|nr:histidine triad nucleotide-binding protein [Myxococcales bacterium]
MSDCLFCRIVRGEIPAKVVYENDHVLAFHDIQPQAPVHTLVIPKIHVESLARLGAQQRELAAELVLGVQQVARLTGVESSGYRTVANTGAHGGQSVFHLHLHVLGGRPLSWPPGLAELGEACGYPPAGHFAGLRWSSLGCSTLGKDRRTRWQLRRRRQ